MSVKPNKNDSTLQSNFDNESDRRKAQRSSERGKLPSRKYTRSPDRSHKRQKHSTHRAVRYRHKSRSPIRRSRSPRKESSGCSLNYDKAMHAQERLARRLERAKGLMKQKGEPTKWEKRRESELTEGFDEAMKRAADIASRSATGTSIEGLSSRATAQIEALRAKALAETGIEVPSYYNPFAINPMNYAQQVAKRKKLWAKKDDSGTGKDHMDQTSEAKASPWSGVRFGDDKSDEKFAKLMGIRSLKGQTTTGSLDIIKKQAEVFQNLDIQYQQARLATHTQRGVGLGFSSSVIDPNLPTQSTNTAQSSSR